MILPRRLFLQLAAATVTPWVALSTAASAPERPAAGAKTYLSRSQAVKLHDQIAEIPAATRRKFARRYAAWRKTWASPALALHSDTAAFRKSPKFAALVALGPPILPLLIEKIAHPDAFFALQAYAALRPDWPAQIETNGEQVFESEQAKAKRAVTDWLAP
ncbi:MAG TPA: hypothetical protein VIY51_27980 [Xanthobacteraceae bacterium]